MMSLTRKTVKSGDCSIRILFFNLHNTENTCMLAVNFISGNNLRILNQ